METPKYQNGCLLEGETKMGAFLADMDQVAYFDRSLKVPRKEADLFSRALVTLEVSHSAEFKHDYVLYSWPRATRVYDIQQMAKKLEPERT